MIGQKSSFQLLLFFDQSQTLDSAVICANAAHVTLSFNRTMSHVIPTSDLILLSNDVTNTGQFPGKLSRP